MHLPRSIAFHRARPQLRSGRTVLSVALVLLAAGCRPQPTSAPGDGGPGSPGLADDGAAAPAPTLADEKAAVAAMDANWPTETYNSEAGPAKKLIYNAIKSLSPLGDEAAGGMAADFKGEDLSARDYSKDWTQSGIRMGDWAERPVDLDAAAFRTAFNRYLSEFETVDTVEVHTWELQLPDAPAGTVRLEAKDAVWVVGRDRDGQVREDRLHLVFDLEKPEAGKEWTLTGLRTEQGRTARAPRNHFTDITAMALPSGYDQVGAQVYTDGGPAFGDVDGDGDDDLFLPRQHAPAKLYLNDGQGRFSDMTVDLGLQTLDLAEDSNAGVFLDYDRDGRLDLAVGLKSKGLRLFHNEGGSFADVTGPANPLGPGQWQTLSVADYDNDGFPDIYAANYGLIDAEHQPESYVDARDGLPNKLLRNDGGSGRFVDATEDAGMASTNDRWTYAAAWADYDRDGDQDLFVANDYGPTWFWRNRGGGRFEEVSAEIGAVNHGNGMGLSWFDYDGDGWLDAYISNMQSFAGNRITRMDHFPGTDEQKAMYRRFSQGNALLRNTGDGRFENVTDRAGVRYAFFAWGNLGWDYDNDGDMDIYGNGGFYTGNKADDT